MLFISIYFLQEGEQLGGGSGDRRADLVPDANAAHEAPHPPPHIPLKVVRQLVIRPDGIRNIRIYCTLSGV